MKMKKILAMLLAVLMIVTATVAGTIAWLQDSTQEVKNTFTTSDINITLEETDADEDGNADENEYQMVPGSTITKDPVVTVIGGSEACWLFVEIIESDNYGDYLNDYSVIDGENGWTALADEEGVYYRVVEASDAEQSFQVLVGNQITVKTSVTKEMMNAFDTDKDGTLSDAEKEALPTLTFKAYAVQKANVADAEAAWDIAKGLVTE